MYVCMYVCMKKKVVLECIYMYVCTKKKVVTISASVGDEYILDFEALSA